MATATDHNIFAELKADHERIKDILEQLTETEESDKERPDLLLQLKEVLEPHSKAEEKIFYDFLRAKGTDDEPEELANEGYVEHSLAESLMAQLENTDPSTKEWTAQVKVLKEVLEHHIKEEEGELFDTAKDLVDKNTAVELAEEFEEEKHRIEESLH